MTDDFAEREAVAGMHVSLSWLRDFFYFRTGARKVLLIFDCCYAGNIVQATAMRPPGEIIDQFAKTLKEAFDLTRDTSNYRPDMLRYALTATVSGQAAGEEDGRGIMTRYLLQALQDEVERVIDLDDYGKVSLFSVYEYLQTEMRTSSQQPDLPGNPGGNACVLAYYEELAEQIRRRRLATINETPTSYLPLGHNPSFQPRAGEFETIRSTPLPLQKHLLSVPVVERVQNASMDTMEER